MDGILVLAKPTGPTSHDMVALVRRLAVTRRVGHGGTLDPFASGVLPLFLGRATRLAEYHLGDGKSYRATVSFGATSTSDDLEGELEPIEQVPTLGEVEAVLDRFRGPIVQVPPSLSAIKVAGRRAYALARAGKPPELAPRKVTISRLELTGWDDSEPGRPTATIEVDCSAGTYIRALARDIGAAVGSGAYLGALARTASGPFTLAVAHMLEEVRAAAAAGSERLEALLLPIDEGIDFPEVALGADAAAAIARGQFVRPTTVTDVARDAELVRVVDRDDRLIAVARWREGRLAPEKVLVDPPADPRSEGIRVLAESIAIVDAVAESERDPGLDVDSDPVTEDGV